MLDLLSRLVDKSLVLADGGAEGEARYRLLETVRQYAQERLAEAGEAAASGSATATGSWAWPSGPSRSCAGRTRWPGWSGWRPSTTTCAPALAWSVAQPEHVEATLRLVGALYRFWQVRHIGEGLGWLTQALEATTSRGQIDLPMLQAPYAKAAIGAGVLGRDLGDLQTARRWMEQSLAIRRTLGDRWGIGQVLNNLATIETIERNYEAARTVTEESVAIWREVGDPWGLSRALGNLGEVLMVEGDVAAATAALDECLTLARAINDVQLMSWQRHHLAGLLLQSAEYGRAEELLLESETLQREMGDRYALGRVLADLGMLATRRGDHERAARLLQESIDLFSALGNLGGVGQVLWRLAEDEAVQGRADRAARLLGAATALRERAGADAPLIPTDAVDVLARVQADLGEQASTAAQREGRMMTVEQAVAFALEGAGDG